MKLSQSNCNIGYSSHNELNFTLAPNYKFWWGILKEHFCKVFFFNLAIWFWKRICYCTKMGMTTIKMTADVKVMTIAQHGTWTLWPKQAKIYEFTIFMNVINCCFFVCIKLLLTVFTNKFGIFIQTAKKLLLAKRIKKFSFTCTCVFVNLWM